MSITGAENPGGDQHVAEVVHVEEGMHAPLPARRGSS